MVPRHGFFGGHFFAEQMVQDSPFLDVQALSCPEESLTQLPKCLGDAQVSSTRVFMKLPPGVPSHAPWKDPK